MSRDHAALQHRIWRDKDFTSQTPAAMLVYCFLLSQGDLSYAGALHVRPRQWARKLPTLGEDAIRAAVHELAANRFVVVDEETEELLLRTFVRNDELWKMPRMLMLAIKQALGIESEELRRAFGVELRRIIPELRAENEKQVLHRGEVVAAAALFPGAGSAALDAGAAAAPETPSDSPPAEGLVDGVPQPPGSGVGAGAPTPEPSPQTPRKRGATEVPAAKGCDRHRRPRQSCQECRQIAERAAMPPQCDECGPGRMRENERGQPFHCPTCHPSAQNPTLHVIGGG